MNFLPCLIAAAAAAVATFSRFAGVVSLAEPAARPQLRAATASTAR